jgi:hypothetical protein
LPVNAASNPLPESPVSLARGGVAPTLFDRRAYGPENLGTTQQKDFCNTIGQKATFPQLFGHVRFTLESGRRVFEFRVHSLVDIVAALLNID